MIMTKTTAIMIDDGGDDKDDAATDDDMMYFIYRARIEIKGIPTVFFTE